MRPVLAALTVFAVSFVVVVGSGNGEAQAAKPEDVFGGRMMTSAKPYPSKSNSAGEYITAVKKQSSDRFDEDKEKKEWRIYYAAFFKKPVNDLELKVTVYTAADHTFITSWEEYLTEAGQRAITGRMNLPEQEGKLEPNTKLLVVMESGGKVVASATIFAIGEAKKHSGKATFTDDETHEPGAKPPEKKDDADADADDKAKQPEKKAPEKKK